MSPYKVLPSPHFLRFCFYLFVLTTHRYPGLPLPSNQPTIAVILDMPDSQSENKQARAPYEVRTPRFSNFPTMEPFDRYTYRGMAAYKRMLETKKQKLEQSLFSPAARSHPT